MQCALGASLHIFNKRAKKITALCEAAFCGLDSSVGRALYWYRRGFDSHSKPDFFKAYFQ